MCVYLCVHVRVYVYVHVCTSVYICVCGYNLRMWRSQACLCTFLCCNMCIVSTCGCTCTCVRACRMMQAMNSQVKDLGDAQLKRGTLLSFMCELHVCACVCVLVCVCMRACAPDNDESRDPQRTTRNSNGFADCSTDLDVCFLPLNCACFQKTRS